jgi:hypothetical protein
MNGIQTEEKMQQLPKKFLHRFIRSLVAFWESYIHIGLTIRDDDEERQREEIQDPRVISVKGKPRTERLTGATEG